MLKKLDDELAFGDESTQEELSALASQGYKTVIDLCTPQEGTQIAAQRAQASGLALKQVPVAVTALSADLVHEFIRQAQQAAAPVYVRCASGKRAGLMALLMRATEQGWSEQEFFRHVQEAGFDCASAPALAQFAVDYMRGLNTAVRQ